MSANGTSAHPLPPARVRAWSRAAYRPFIHLYFQIEYEGRRHLPGDGPAVLVGNHPSYLDPYNVAFGVQRWVTWMAWSEAFGWPVVGPLIRSLGAFPVDVDRPRPSTLRTAKAILAEGRLLGMFFEGSRTEPGELQLSPPLPGAALIALRSKVPVVPFSVAGMRRLWPMGQRLPRPGKVVIRYHPPIDTASFLPDRPTRERSTALTEAIAQAVRSGLPADGRHR